MANPGLSNIQTDNEMLGRIAKPQNIADEKTAAIVNAMMTGEKKSIYDQMVAASQQPPNPVAQFAGAAGAGASGPQTMALVNNPAASGVNNILRLARGFADNVNAGMQKPTYKDMIEAQKLEAAGKGGGADKTQSVAEFWGKSSKPITETLDYYNKAAQSFNKENPAPQDDANIYAAYLKTQFTGMRLNAEGGIDPTSMSGVKGGEVVMDYMNGILNGTKKMRPEERLKYMNAAASNIESYKPQYDMLKKQAEGIADQYGVDKTIAVPDFWKNKIDYSQSIDRVNTEQAAVDTHVKKLKVALSAAKTAEDKTALQAEINRLTPR
jgi:hypothetical protein